MWVCGWIKHKRRKLAVLRDPSNVIFYTLENEIELEGGDAGTWYLGKSVGYLE